jgi:hypothetical protein
MIAWSYYLSPWAGIGLQPCRPFGGIALQFTEEQCKPASNRCAAANLLLIRGLLKSSPMPWQIPIM